jgi:hypothetical protein
MPENILVDTLSRVKRFHADNALEIAGTSRSRLTGARSYLLQKQSAARAFSNSRFRRIGLDLKNHPG